MVMGVDKSKSILKEREDLEAYLIYTDKSGKYTLSNRITIKVTVVKTLPSPPKKSLVTNPLIGPIIIPIRSNNKNIRDFSPAEKFIECMGEKDQQYENNYCSNIFNVISDG